jgi:UDP-glucose 4-epimerase
VKLLKKKGYKLVALDSSNVNAFFINPKEFKNKFKEIDILNNENLKKFIKKNKKTINKIQINRYIKY